MSVDEETSFFSKLEQNDPASSAVTYALCYLVPRHTQLPPRFSTDFIHFDLAMPARRKSAFSIRHGGEAWGGSVLSYSLAMPFAPPIRQLIDELGSMLNAEASFGEAGHHTYIVNPKGQPKASSLAGNLHAVDEIFRQMAMIAKAVPV